jgi:hypothetical protein
VAAPEQRLVISLMQCWQQKPRLAVTLGGSVALLYASAAPGAFVTISPPTGSSNTLYLYVGPEATDTVGTAVVNISIPPVQLGDGTQISGDTVVQIQMGIKRSPGNNSPNLTATLNADLPLWGLYSGTHSIPMSTISWTSAMVVGCDETIANGAFGITSRQQIHQATTVDKNLFWACGALTFLFDNTQIYPAGAYTGTVEFTATRN